MAAEEVVDMSMLTEKETAFSALADERYISITTFRRDGSPASTPVWVVSDDPQRLLIATGPETWKVRRIKSDPRAETASGGRVHRGRCRARGRSGCARRLAAQPVRGESPCGVSTSFTPSRRRP